MPDGSMISFPVNGTQADGYLAVPDGGGPGLLVVQEWWGLDPAIKQTCDRLAGEGFVALAQMPKTQERILHTLTTGKPLRN